MCKICMTIAAGAIVAGAIFSSGMVQAQNPEFRIRPELAEQCLDGKKGNDRYECIGIAADDCQIANDGGGTTVGMGFCFGAERDWWDAKLNAAYRELVADEKADDAEADAGGWNAPRKLPALKQMQRAWIPYRDALCEYEAVQWGGGTGAGPAWSACTMGETARQYLVLQDRLDERGNR